MTGIAEPQPMYKALRESTPVFRAPQAVVLSRLADIEMALKRTDLFSSNMDAVDLGNLRPLIPLQIDPPEHAKYRRILDPLFTPREMARREPYVTELVNEMIDRFAARGECDFHAEFAVPLPCTVFLQLLGLPLEDLDKFLEWKDGVIRPAGSTGYDDRHDASAGVAQQIYEYFDRAIDDHVANPRDDVLSAMIAAQIAGEPLSREELLDICFLFLIAGLDTVTDSLDCFFVYLARHPEHRRQLIEQPDILPHAVEELLRWETPVPGVARVAMRDVEVGAARSARANGSARCSARPTPTPRSSPIPNWWTSPATRTGTAPSAAVRTGASAPTWRAWSCGWRCANSTAASRITRSSPAPSWSTPLPCARCKHCP
ncbi:cytochrome P450 family protein [Mycobacterium kansasii]|uniref:Cytochrome P450 family protein n=1 Tax=Mycobacterium kansasii TaxID=1768 RepID=A0A1V3X3X5_MYCKA|nr:cytochrome P450 family protein [Mycobacterium kansasii]